MSSVDDKESPLPSAASTDSVVEKSSSSGQKKKAARSKEPSQFCCVVECGIVDGAGKRIIKQHTPYFGKDVEVFTACSDPKKRILYRASTLASKFKCATNKVGMYLARRRNTQQGIFQAVSFRMKPSGRSGLKAGGYFLSMEVCLAFEDHYNQQCKKRGKKGGGLDDDDFDMEEGGEGAEPKDGGDGEEEEMTDTTPMASPKAESAPVATAKKRRGGRHAALQVDIKSDVDDIKAGPLSPTLEAVSVLASMSDSASSTSSASSTVVKIEKIGESPAVRRGSRNRKIKHFDDVSNQEDNEDDEDNEEWAPPTPTSRKRNTSGASSQRTSAQRGGGGGGRGNSSHPRQRRQNIDQDDDDWSEQWEDGTTSRNVSRKRKTTSGGNVSPSSLSRSPGSRAPSAKKARSRGSDLMVDEDDDQPRPDPVKTGLEDISSAAALNAISQLSSLSSLSSLATLNSLNLNLNPFASLMQPTLQLQLAAAYGSLPALQRLSSLINSSSAAGGSNSTASMPTANGMTTVNTAGGLNLNALSLLSSLGSTQIPLVSPTKLTPVASSTSGPSLEQQFAASVANATGLQPMTLEQARRALDDLHAQQIKQFGSPEFTLNGASSSPDTSMTPSLESMVDQPMPALDSTPMTSSSSASSEAAAVALRSLASQASPQPVPAPSAPRSPPQPPQQLQQQNPQQLQQLLALSSGLNASLTKSLLSNPLGSLLESLTQPQLAESEMNKSSSLDITKLSSLLNTLNSSLLYQPAAGLSLPFGLLNKSSVPSSTNY